MTKSGLTPKQEDLLVYLVNNKIQNFDLNTAQRIYDTKKHAKSALRTLKQEGFVSKKRAGQYRLEGFPKILQDRIRQDVL